MGDKRKMSKEGYQPLKTKKTIKIIPPNTGSNVQMKKDGYNWEDLDKAWWEGFDNAKSKMKKRIAELEAEKDKAWWEGFDTCKAKAGEANVKLNDELEKLKKQLEELPDKWCRNKDDYCPHLAKLEAQIEKMQDDIDCLTFACENYREEMEKNLANATELEKENAELKERLEITDLALDNCLKESEVEK
jgi:chromosome segregation ATPase